jgi:predicted RNA-binding Zn-ribbon protein involved in translation (DUF1610 family)
MKKIIFKCTVCGWKVSYNNTLQNSTTFTCTNCKTEYDESIFTSSRTRNSSKHFKKYGILIAILSAFYLLFLVYRVLID